MKANGYEPVGPRLVHRNEEKKAASETRGRQSSATTKERTAEEKNRKDDRAQCTLQTSLHFAGRRAGRLETSSPKTHRITAQWSSYKRGPLPEIGRRGQARTSKQRSLEIMYNYIRPRLCAP